MNLFLSNRNMKVCVQTCVKNAWSITDRNTKVCVKACVEVCVKNAWSIKGACGKRRSYVVAANSRQIKENALKPLDFRALTDKIKTKWCPEEDSKSARLLDCGDGVSEKCVNNKNYAVFWFAVQSSISERTKRLRGILLIVGNNLGLGKFGKCTQRS
jgi:hypothetical protein